MKYAITGKIRAGKASLVWLEQKDGSFKLPIAKSLVATLEMKTRDLEEEGVYVHEYKVRLHVVDLDYDHIRQSETFTSVNAPDLLSWGSQIVIDSVMQIMKDSKTWQ